MALKPAHHRGCASPQETPDADLTKLVVGLSLALGFVATAAAQTTMRISISVAQNSHQGVAIDTFAKEVESARAAAIRFKPSTTAHWAVSANPSKPCSWARKSWPSAPAAPSPTFVPETKILDVPFLFRDKAHARAVLDGPIGQELLAKFDRQGLQGPGLGRMRFRYMTNSKRSVTARRPQGLKMRTMENPVHIAAYKGFGIITTPMAFPEVFTALQQGTVDGQENPLPVIISAKFDQVQKHLTLTGHVYSPCIFVMNKAAFDKLALQTSRPSSTLLKEGTKANRARVDEDDAKGVADLRAKGMTVVDNPDKAKFVAALAPVNAEFEKQFGKATLDKILCREVIAWPLAFSLHNS